MTDRFRPKPRRARRGARAPSWTVPGEAHGGGVHELLHTELQPARGARLQLHGDLRITDGGRGLSVRDVDELVLRVASGLHDDVARLDLTDVDQRQRETFGVHAFDKGRHVGRNTGPPRDGIKIADAAEEDRAAAGMT